jgi:hypothetical protein
MNVVKTRLPGNRVSASQVPAGIPRTMLIPSATSVTDSERSAISTTVESSEKIRRSASRRASMMVWMSHLRG